MRSHGIGALLPTDTINIRYATGVKYHHLEEETDPDALNRAVHERDERLLRDFAERYFPDGCGPTMDLQACMFTNTEDDHFVLDPQPEHPQVILASPCSGHGFKFASVVGEMLAVLVTRGETTHDTSMFRLDRLARRPGRSLRRAEQTEIGNAP